MVFSSAYLHNKGFDSKLEVGVRVVKGNRGPLTDAWPRPVFCADTSCVNIEKKLCWECSSLFGLGFTQKARNSQ